VLAPILISFAAKNQLLVLHVAFAEARQVARSGMLK
jgi:hypothetical protein